MNNREYDYLFKLVIIGDSGVGKSSVLLRFADDQFNESYLTTIGVDFRFKTLPIEGKNVKLQIWDTAGQERFRTITNAYYKGADGIVIVYDTTSQQSFESIEKFWLNEVESYAEKNVELLLLGNKNDVAELKQVDTEKVQDYAQKRKMEFYEVSAKTAEKVEEAFLLISKKLMKKRDEQISLKKKSRRNKNNDKDSSDIQSNNTYSSSQQSQQQQETSTQQQKQGEKLQLNKPKSQQKEGGGVSGRISTCCNM